MLFVASFDVKCCFMSLRNFFTARVYAKLLQNDPYGRISNMQFFNYVMRKGVELWICAELQVSPDAGFLILICPPRPFQSGCIRPALAWVYMMWQDRATSGSWSVPFFFFSLRRVLCSDCRLTLVAWLQDLENYILELIPTLPQLDGLEKSFYSFYVCTAVRKFFFFLDPLRTGESEP